MKEKIEDDFDLEGELEYDGTQEDFFVPNRKPKHHASKTFSDTNPEQKKVNKNKAKKEKGKVVMKIQVKMTLKLTWA